MWLVTDLMCLCVDTWMVAVTFLRYRHLQVRTNCSACTSSIHIWRSLVVLFFFLFHASIDSCDRWYFLDRDHLFSIAHLVISHGVRLPRFPPVHLRGYRPSWICKSSCYIYVIYSRATSTNANISTSTSQVWFASLGGFLVTRLRLFPRLLSAICARCRLCMDGFLSNECLFHEFFLLFFFPRPHLLMSSCSIPCWNSYHFRPSSSISSNLTQAKRSL